MFYGPECGLSWWMFYVKLRRMCILLLLLEVVYWCQLYTFDWWCCLSSATYLLIFCLLDLSIFDRRALKSPTMIVNSSISPYSFFSFCLTYFDIQYLGAYMLRIVMPSWSIGSFIIMLYTSYLFRAELWSLLYLKLI